MANKTTALAAGGALALAFGYSFTRRQRRLQAEATASRLDARRARPVQLEAASPEGADIPDSGQLLAANGPVPAQVKRAEEQETQQAAAAQELDGGVSARPTAHLHDEVNDPYDAVSPDSLGAEFLSRATEAPLQDVKQESWDWSDLATEQDDGQQADTEEADLLQDELPLDASQDDLLRDDIAAGTGGVSEASLRATHTPGDESAEDAPDGGSVAGRTASDDSALKDVDNDASRAQLDASKDIQAEEKNWR